MKNFILVMLSDTAGIISSKRVITAAAFLFCSIGYFANLFWGLKSDQFIFDAMMYIVISGMGFTGMEKFAPKSKIDILEEK